MWRRITIVEQISGLGGVAQQPAATETITRRGAEVWQGEEGSCLGRPIGDRMARSLGSSSSFAAVPKHRYILLELMCEYVLFFLFQFREDLLGQSKKADDMSRVAGLDNQGIVGL